jgi:preprotein translocase subunit SecA
MKCTIPTGTAAQPPRQAPRPAAAPRVQEQKAGVANTAEQGAAARAQAQAAHVAQGGLPGRAPMPGRPGAIAPGRMPQQAPRPQPVQPIRTEKKVLPNDPCPCGSGKKYKKCHG